NRHHPEQDLATTTVPASLPEYSAACSLERPYLIQSQTQKRRGRGHSEPSNKNCSQLPRRPHCPAGPQPLTGSVCPPRPILHQPPTQRTPTLLLHSLLSRFGSRRQGTMGKFWWRAAAWGLCLVQLSLAQQTIGECPPGSGRNGRDKPSPARAALALGTYSNGPPEPPGQEEHGQQGGTKDPGAGAASIPWSVFGKQQAHYLGRSPGTSKTTEAQAASSGRGLDSQLRRELSCGVTDPLRGPVLWVPGTWQAWLGALRRDVQTSGELCLTKGGLQRDSGRYHGHRDPVQWCVVHDLNVTCRYAGVFHVEKNGRYSISRTEAADLCEAFNATLPTMAQMQRALTAGFETCRYGFIDGHVVIPRINPNSICAANNTGVYILTSNTSQYDTYCFNASAPEDEDCTSITDLPNTFEGPVSITIVNRDGTRYTKKGEYRTNPNDINPSLAPEEEISSGSSSERSTSGGYIFNTQLPTIYPTDDYRDEFAVSSKTDDSPATMVTTALMSASDTTPKTATKKQEAHDWFSWWFQPSETKNHLLPTTKMAGTDSNIISAGWEPTEENEDEREKHPSYSGSGIDDDEDFISSTISTTPPVLTHPGENMDWTQWAPGFMDPEKLPQTTTTSMNVIVYITIIMADVDKSGTSDYGENLTQEPQPPLVHHEHQDEEETQHSTSTTQATPSSTTEETATEKEQWFGNGWHGVYTQMPKEDSDATAGTPATSAHENHPSQRMTTLSPEDSSWINFFNSVSHPMEPGHQTQGSMDMGTSDSTTLRPSEDQNTGLVEDLDRTGLFSITTRCVSSLKLMLTSSLIETEQSHMQSFSTSQGNFEEDNDHPVTSTSAPSNSNDDAVERDDESHPEDSTPSAEGYTSHSSDSKDTRTHIPVTPLNTGSPGVTEVTVVGDSNFNVDRSFSGDQDSISDPSGDSHATTHGSESAGHSSGSRDSGPNTTSGPVRNAQIPEWLIILASLLALALILAVCIAVNSRRRCGQKKKLVINNGNGAVDDRKPSGLNGEASKSQEMVHLVNKEPVDSQDQFMTADETRNLQNVDMKIGA
ncbi:CD44 antigen, partial [Galemys pyrenaicus]